ncbi:hypothetical protein ACCO45_005929 [Purpureocillium lilacinum]|uniref:Uncharacterized protein n=1 Tax=Purpureocillium lilacinum TaxID=33203 RepID=A0ACC4DY16_PURLI
MYGPVLAGASRGTRKERGTASRTEASRFPEPLLFSVLVAPSSHGAALGQARQVSSHAGFPRDALWPWGAAPTTSPSLADLQPTQTTPRKLPPLNQHSPSSPHMRAHGTAEQPTPARLSATLRLAHGTNLSARADRSTAWLKGRRHQGTPATDIPNWAARWGPLSSRVGAEAAVGDSSTWRLQQRTNRPTDIDCDRTLLCSLWGCFTQPFAAFLPRPTSWQSCSRVDEAKLLCVNGNPAVKPSDGPKRTGSTQSRLNRIRPHREAVLQKNLWDGTNAPDGDGDGRQISWRLLGRVRSARTAASSKRSRHANELGPALTSTAAACPGIIAAQMSATGGESGASVPLTHSVRPQVSLSNRTAVLSGYQRCRQQVGRDRRDGRKGQVASIRIDPSSPTPVASALGAP